jgi:hypothetical protein
VDHDALADLDEVVADDERSGWMTLPSPIAASRSVCVAFAAQRRKRRSLIRACSGGRGVLRMPLIAGKSKFAGVLPQRLERALSLPEGAHVLDVGGWTAPLNRSDG